jgi:hypothetical protein
MGQTTCEESIFSPIYKHANIQLGKLMTILIHNKTICILLEFPQNFKKFKISSLFIVNYFNNLFG